MNFRHKTCFSNQQYYQYQAVPEPHFSQLKSSIMPGFHAK
ncbi:MAG: KTSC domain-containing protein [Enterobacteriaceae bacterium]|nr:KTSC domain-containing protein [Enterobacteriaceae bacterium]